MDSIINFGENLPEDELELGFTNSESADLIVIMGTSCRVSPACDMPRQTVLNGGKLVICNLQKTPLDAYAALNIYAKCDDIMEKLCEKLGIPIKPWKLERLIQIKVIDQKIEVSGRDEMLNPYSLFKSVSVKYSKSKKSSDQEPFVFPFKAEKLSITMEF